MVPFLCGCGATVAQRTYNPCVVGSTPTSRTTTGESPWLHWVPSFPISRSP